MATRFDIMTPRKSKDGKTFWTRIGTAWQGDKGIQLVFDALPLPDAEGRCVASLFEPRDNQRKANNNDGWQGKAPADDLNDEVPW